MSTPFLPGQRWSSEPEPELGLGVIVEVSARMVEVFFPTSEETRVYVADAAPLRRVVFRVGDVVQSRTGEPFAVQEVVDLEGLLLYRGDQTETLETSLLDTLLTHSPEDRLRQGLWSSASEHSLRQELLTFQERWLRSPARGLVGGRISLLPHQLFLAREAIRRQRLRILLADEPGLGKTIEACLVLHKELILGRANRVLILAPESLLHQWFAELMRRFQLPFRVVDEEHCQRLEEDSPEQNPLEEDAWVLCASDWLLRSPKRREQALAAEWDLLIVDEAHHVHVDSEEFQALANLSSHIDKLLLLTATPEQMGAESHFARLQLLDPARYADFLSYQQQHKRARELAALVDSLVSPEEFPLSPETEEFWKQRDPAALALVQDHSGLDEEDTRERIRGLVDRFGPGRAMFRNTRAAIAGFPSRSVHLLPLHAEDFQEAQEGLFGEARRLCPDPRFHWLVRWLHEHNEKVLLLCQSQGLVERLEEWLRLQSNASTSVFHEGLSLLQRDRNAAWFAEPEGAQILLSSEIGGEGRNFQFAQHLILFDVPPDPELLEQRIGRLDRIGQSAEIHLHLPYVTGTEQELWVRWYHQGLDAFCQSRPGGNVVLAKALPALSEMAIGGWTEQSLHTLLEETSRFQEELQAELRAGKNRLLQWSSFDPTEVESLMEALEDAEDDPALLPLCSALFDLFGVDVEKLSLDQWLLAPTVRLHPSFPWLKGDKRLVTFDREQALVQESALFLTADHPMFRESVALFLSSERGSCSVVQVEGMSPEIRLECTFVVECIAPPTLRTERFLPPTPLRLTLNHEQTLVESLDLEGCETAPQALFDEHPAVFLDLVPALLKRGTEVCEREKEPVLRAALKEAELHYAQELGRLRALQQLNPAVSLEEVDALAQEEAAVLQHLRRARTRLDSLQVQFVGSL